MSMASAGCPSLDSCINTKVLLGLTLPRYPAEVRVALYILLGEYSATLLSKSVQDIHDSPANG